MCPHKANQIWAVWEQPVHIAHSGVDIAMDQDHGFLLGVDHKGTVDKTICYLFIFMNLEFDQW